MATLKDMPIPTPIAMPTPILSSATPSETPTAMPSGKPINWTGPVHDYVHKLFPKLPELCSDTGHFSLFDIHSYTHLSGIEYKASTFVLDDFAKDYDYDNRFLDLGVLAAWIVVLRLFTFITMYFVNHQKR